VGGGVSAEGNSVDAMYNYQSKLYVAGQFDTVGSNMPAKRLAIWNGSAWDTLPTFEYNFFSVISLINYNNKLALVGYFHKYGAGAGTYTNIMFWDGVNLQECNNCNNGNGQINCVASYKGDLYVGGTFTQMGGVSAQRIAKWNGTTWSSVGGGITSGFMPNVSQMSIYNNELIVVGDMSQVGGNLSVSDIARWDGTNWSKLKEGVNFPPEALVVDSINNLLYVGGQFTTAGNNGGLRGMASWDGNNWNKLNDEILGGITVLAMYKIIYMQVVILPQILLTIR